MTEVTIHKPLFRNVAELVDHPRNYKSHPDDQIEHLCANIAANGLYRNIVIAKNGTILAGHGVVKACRKLGMDQLPVIELDIDPNSPRALKLIAADNEISHLAEVDDRALTNLLKEVLDVDTLLGTGFDEQMLANMVFVTRHENEVGSLNEAAEWVGMPEFDPIEMPHKLVINFKSEEDRDTFCATAGVKVLKREAKTWTTKWPFEGMEDLKSLRFDR